MNGTTVNAANPAPNQSLFFKACVASYILKASPITGASYKSNTLLTQPAPGLYPYVGLYGSPLGSKLVIGLSLVVCGGISSIVPPSAYFFQSQYLSQGLFSLAYLYCCILYLNASRSIIIYFSFHFQMTFCHLSFHRMP